MLTFSLPAAETEEQDEKPYRITILLLLAGVVATTSCDKLDDYLGHPTDGRNRQFDHAGPER